MTFEPLPAGKYAFEYAYRGGGTINVVNSFTSGKVTLDEALGDYSGSFTEIIEDGSVSLDFDMAVGGMHRRPRPDGLGREPGGPARRAVAPVRRRRRLHPLGAGPRVRRDHRQPRRLPLQLVARRDLHRARRRREQLHPRILGGQARRDRRRGRHLRRGDRWRHRERTSVLGLGGRTTGTVKNTSGQPLRDIVATAYILGDDFEHQAVRQRRDRVNGGVQHQAVCPPAPTGSALRPPSRRASSTSTGTGPAAATRGRRVLHARHRCDQGRRQRDHDQGRQHLWRDLARRRRVPRRRTSISASALSTGTYHTGASPTGSAPTTRPPVHSR